MRRTAMHTLRLHIKTTAADEALLMKRFRLMNRIHNVLVKRCMALLAKLGNDRAYQGLLSAYRALGKDGNHKERKRLTAEMSEVRECIGLTKAALEKYISVEQKRYSAHITSHQAQAEVSRVWEGVERVFFGNGKRLRFRKLDSMRTIGGKSVNGAMRSRMAFSNVLMTIWSLFSTKSHLFTTTTRLLLFFCMSWKMFMSCVSMPLVASIMSMHTSEFSIERMLRMTL